MKFTIENLTNKAKELVTFSEIMTGREKMSIDEVIFNYPDGVHIHEVDFVQDGEKYYLVFVTKEEPNKFTFGGQVVTDIFWGLIDNEIDNLPELNECLRNTYGLPVKFKKVTTKNKRTATVVDILS